MNKLILIFMFSLFTISLFSQNITNTLGSSGLFIVKDGSTNFLTLYQSTGFLSFSNGIILPTTINSVTGVIYKGTNRFIHNFQAPGTDGANIFIGINSGNFTLAGTMQDASYNTAVGQNSLSSLTAGFNNSAFGNGSMQSNTDGFYNSAFGNNSLGSNTIGRLNSAFGFESLSSNSTGAFNTATGAFSLNSNTTATDNSAFGYSALSSNTTGSENSAMGYSSLDNNLTGNYNAAFGSSSLYSNTIGNNNSAFGVASLYSNTSGYFNSGSGYFSLYSNATGHSNSAFGSYSLRSNTTGIGNSAFGVYSLYSNNGDENTAVGNNSLYSNTTGWHNTALGYNTLFDNVTGWRNTAVGHHSLENNTGNYNTALGDNAGATVTSGENLTLIGIDANPSSPTAINEITLGNVFVGTLRCNVTTITSLSDKRDKKNITDLALGLDFITKLKPRQFNWDKREWYDDNKSDGSKMKEEPTAGFIAQELDEIQTSENAEWLNLVLKNNPDKWETTPGNLFPIVVKAIQELNEKNEQLKIENEELKKEKDEEITQLREDYYLLVYEFRKLKSLDEQLSEIQNLRTELIEYIKLLKANSDDEDINFSSAGN